MRLLLSGILIALAACSTPSGTQHLGLEPLHSLETLDLAYSGALSSEDLPEGQFVPATVTEHDRMIDVRVKVFEVDKDALPAIMSEGKVWLRADRVERATATKILSQLIEEDRAALLFNPRIQFHRGGTTNLKVGNSISYVDSFSLEPFGDSALGDPHIAICQDGFMAEVSAPVEGPADSCEVHLKVSMAELQRPMATSESKLPGSDVSMSIQTPIFATQEFELDALLRPDDMVVIGPLPAFSGDRPMIVVLTAEPAPSPGPEVTREARGLNEWLELQSNK